MMKFSEALDNYLNALEALKRARQDYPGTPYAERVEDDVKEQRSILDAVFERKFT